MFTHIPNLLMKKSHEEVGLTRRGGLPAEVKSVLCVTEDAS